MRQAGEPAVEDILESIKKVIVRDAQAPAIDKLVAVPADPEAADEPESHEEEILDLSTEFAPLEEGPLMKSATVGSISDSLAALQAMTAPNAPVDVMITLQPMNICQAAADLLWSPIPRHFPGLKIALTEGGGGDLDAAGHKLAVTVMAAEKIFAVFVLETTGPGGHSSKPRPENPIITLAQALANLKTLAFPAELNTNSRAYFTALAPRVDAETGAAIRKLLADPLDPAANAALDRQVSWRAMLRTTCIPTQLEGGHAVNAQPQRARAIINCRLLPGSPLESAKAALVAAVNNPAVKVTDATPGSGSGRTERAPPPPLTAQVMGPIEQVAAKVFPGVPVTPMQETFGTDAGRLVAVGIPTYGFSALFRGDDAGNIHGLNEHISVQSVMEGRDFMYRLIKVYAEQR